MDFVPKVKWFQKMQDYWCIL